MNALPEPRPTLTDGQPGDDLLDATVAAAVEHSIDQARKHGTSPEVVIGSTPPVPQPDSRIVPTWATGLAVASLGVGAGSTGLGCAAWLLFKGLSLVSVPSLERFAFIIIAPFAGAAMLATAVAAALKRARSAEPREVHNHGPVYETHHEDYSRTKTFSFTTKHDTTINPDPTPTSRRKRRR